MCHSIRGGGYEISFGSNHIRIHVFNINKNHIAFDPDIGIKSVSNDEAKSMDEKKIDNNASSVSNSEHTEETMDNENELSSIQRLEMEVRKQEQRIHEILLDLQTPTKEENVGDSAGFLEMDENIFF